MESVVYCKDCDYCCLFWSSNGAINDKLTESAVGGIVSGIADGDSSY